MFWRGCFCTCKARCSEAESLIEAEFAVNKEKKLPAIKWLDSSQDTRILINLTPTQFFRHASVSSTYPCPSVCKSVTLSDFQSLVALSEKWKVNSEQRTANSERWTANSEQWKVKGEQRTANSERWKVKSEKRKVKRNSTPLRICTPLHTTPHHSTPHHTTPHMYLTCVSSKLCEFIYASPNSSLPNCL